MMQHEIKVKEGEKGVKRVGGRKDVTSDEVP